VGMRETRATEPLATHRNPLVDIKTGAAYQLREQPGRRLLTGQVMSGVQAA